MPVHPELFTSLSLMMASLQIPFVFDRTGIVLEFLKNMTLCNHSVSHDDDAPLPPPQTEISNDSSGVLVHSTRDFPIFVRACSAAAAWTDAGRAPGADCVVLTMPESNDAIDIVTSACNDGRLLIFRIPAQKLHAAAALQNLIAFVPLLSLSKFRNPDIRVRLLDSMHRSIVWLCRNEGLSERLILNLIHRHPQLMRSLS
jgi:hypothetical protein